MTNLQSDAQTRIVQVEIIDNRLRVTLADGREITAALAAYPRLLHATAEEREIHHLLGDGYAIEWPLLDEHIGIEGLLAGRRSSESPKSLQRWLDNRHTN